MDTDYGKLSPGTISVIKEIEHAQSLGLKYYYLGYYIKDNHSMSYKGRFFPQELYDWKSKEWIRREKREGNK